MKTLIKFIFLFFAQVTLAQPVELLVTYPPGGAVDVFARNFQKYLSGAGIQSVVVNKPGADGKVGVGYILNKSIDSNTVMIAATGPILFNKVLYSNNGYDYTQFDMTVPMARTPLVIAVSNQSGISTLQEFLERARTQKLNCGTSNSGSGFAGRYIVKQLKMTSTEVISFKGASDVTANLIGGNIDCAIDPLSTLANAHRDNKIKIIAIAGHTKNQEFPQLPLVKQVIDDFEFYYWFGLATVKGHQVDPRVHTLAQQAFKDSDLIKSLRLLEYEIIKPAPDSIKFLDLEFNRFEIMRRHLGLEKVVN